MKGKISREERDNAMFLEYCKGISLREIAEDYGLNYNTVKKISCEQKWANRKLTNGKTVTDIVNQHFINTSKDLVEKFYSEDMYAYNECLNMLHDENCYTDKNGMKSIYKFRQIIETMILIEDRLKDLTGILDAKTLADIDNRNILTNIKKALSGVDDDNAWTVEEADKFYEALMYSAKQNGIVKEDKDNTEE